MWVLEHGAGGSTLWFAGKVQHVITVEHNPEWRQKIQDLAPAHNVTVLERLPDLGYVYDLFFIDGERAQRGNCLEMAHLYVRPGGWVVLDNANRPEYAQQREGLRQHARLIERFDNNIPRFHYIVTEFWQQICEPK
jgi:predicted O-methyltransferase YrrM